MAREVRVEDVLGTGKGGRRRDSYNMNIVEMKSSQMMKTGHEIPGQMQEGPEAKSWL